MSTPNKGRVAPNRPTSHRSETINSKNVKKHLFEGTTEQIRNWRRRYNLWKE